MSEDTGLAEVSEQAEEAVAEAGEQPTQDTELEAKPEGDEEEGWSIKNVPEQIRAEVEKAIKPFHRKYTKTRQELKKKEQAWEQEKASYISKTDYENVIKHLRGALTDENYRKTLQAQFGVQPPRTDYPEGWNSPEAVQARNLLLDEFKKAVLQELSPILEGQKGLSGQVMQMLTRDAQSEIDATSAEVKKEGLPWNDEILEACIDRVKKFTRQGKQVTLREAYDSFYKPMIKAHQEIEASRGERKKGLKPFAPTTSGDKQLTGDDKLRAIISQLPIQDETL